MNVGSNPPWATKHNMEKKEMTNEEMIDKSWRMGKCAGNKYWYIWFVPYSVLLVAIGSYIQHLG